MIDINTLSKRDLLDLNRQIVARLNFMTRQEASLKLAHFNLYDLVTVGSGSHQQYAIVMRINQKTIGILCESTERWKVSPEMIAKVKKQPQEIRSIFSKRFPSFKAITGEFETPHQ